MRPAAIKIGYEDILCWPWILVGPNPQYPFTAILTEEALPVPLEAQSQSLNPR